MKIYKIANKFENLYSRVEEAMNRENSSQSIIHHSDWQVNGSEYILRGVDANLVSIWQEDDNVFIPNVLGKQYEICSSLEEASDLILDIVESGHDEYYEPYKELTMEENFEKKIEETPRSTFWPHVGYILPNGEGMDFHAGNGDRKDHRTIYDGSTKGMQEFMMRGAIRIVCDKSMTFCGIDIYRKPTPQQYNMLQTLGKDIRETQGDIRLDMSSDFEYDERREVYYPKDSKSIEINPMNLIFEIKTFYS